MSFSNQMVHVKGNPQRVGTRDIAYSVSAIAGQRLDPSAALQLKGLASQVSATKLGLCNKVRQVAEDRLVAVDSRL